MPRQRAPRLIKQALLPGAIVAEPIDQAVVGGDERDMHLAHEHVDVVARVADQRDPFLIARHVPVGLEQLRGVIPLVEVRRAEWAASVQRLQICSRRADVAKRLEVGVLAQRRAIRRQVMRHVLPEEWPSRLDTRVAPTIAGIAESAGRPDPVK
jgi:hypothetical protein